MKQHQFVLSTFLVLGLLTLFIGVYPDVTTTTTTTFKVRSKNTTKKAKKAVEVETMSKIDSKCYHPGISHIVLSVVSNYAKIKKSDFITLEKNGITLKKGRVQTSIRLGQFNLGQGKYIELNCGTLWIEQVKDYIADGEEVPENLR